MKPDEKTVERFMRSVRGLPEERPPVAPTANDGRDLARDLAVAFHQQLLKHDRATIDGWQLFEMKDLKYEDLVRISMDKPPEQVSFFDIDRIARHSPEAALTKWEEVKETARHDVANGRHAARSRYHRIDLRRKRVATRKLLNLCRIQIAQR